MTEPPPQKNPKERCVPELRRGAASPLPLQYFHYIVLYKVYDSGLKVQSLAYQDHRSRH